LLLLLLYSLRGLLLRLLLLLLQLQLLLSSLQPWTPVVPV
jgi:hypothetical protein